MINSNITINSSMDTVKAKVELYNGSTLVQTCTCGDYLQDFTIDRAGESSKFFGFGICHKLQAHLIDLERSLIVEKGYMIKIAYSTNDSVFIYPYPNFYVTEVSRDDTASLINITAYDAINFATEHTVSELSVAAYSLDYYAAAICNLLGLKGCEVAESIMSAFEIDYDDNNFDGTETVRQFLNAMAEVTQTIYYVGNDNYLVFKRLNKSGPALLTISKEDYFSLTLAAARTLTSICHATELGDNIEASAEEKDATQYIRDNGFWELREDVATLLDNALDAVGGLTIIPFTCEWVGNYLLEIGDKIAIVAEDDNEATTYVLNDFITYDGTLMATTQWQYEDNAAETFSNPTSLGEIINQTYARVDKVSKQIELLASEKTDTTSAIAALQINTESIAASVKTIEENTNNAIDTINENYETLSKEVSAKITAEDVQIAIESELSNGVDKVTTTTGFTFDHEGLTVSKSGSEMTTQITEDGMTVSKNGSETLTANNQGVKAVNLHATTWLVVGNNSRFEDYNDGGKRTGCFWIG